MDATLNDLKAEKPSLEDEKIEQRSHEYAPDDTSDNVEYRKKEAALVRKLDCFVAPVMMLLMLISYLDRGNIGFAATQGMTTDIHLEGSQLNVCHTRQRRNETTDNVADCCFRILHFLHPG